MRNSRIVRRMIYSLQLHKPSYITNTHYSTLPKTNSKKALFNCLFSSRNYVATGTNVVSCFHKPISSKLGYSSSSAAHSDETTQQQSSKRDDFDGEVEPIDSWEEVDDAEAEIDDGGDGGGVVLNNCSWGERALAIARQVLLQFDVNGMKLYAFKTSPNGYVYVRLDKLSNQYGCPGMDEIESFHRLYNKILDEIGATGEIPDDLAVEVSSPGMNRLLRVPDDLLRFQDMPMVVRYVEDSEAKCHEKDGVFFLDSVETESKCCVWKLADVKENRDPLAKGRPLNRKRKDWRLKLPYDMIKRVGLYVNY